MSPEPMSIRNDMRQVSKDSIMIENEHNYKGTRALLIVIRIIMIAIHLAVIYAVMKKVEDGDAMKKWVRTSVGLCFVYILIFDTIMCFIYGVLIGKARTTGVNTTMQAILSCILVGNMDYRARISACLEMAA